MSDGEVRLRIEVDGKYATNSDEIEQAKHETDEAFMARALAMLQKLKKED